MRTVYLKHSTFSVLNVFGYDPYNSAVVIMRSKYFRW